MLRQIAAGEYQIERRKMLDVAVSRDGNILQRETCLNDVVITKGLWRESYDCCVLRPNPGDGIWRRRRHCGHAHRLDCV